MTRRTIGLLALVLSAGLVVPTSVAARPAGPPHAAVPGTSCSLFPFDNVWNMDISKLPVHAKSDVWKKAMHAGKKKLHPGLRSTELRHPVQRRGRRSADDPHRLHVCGGERSGALPLQRGDPDRGRLGPPCPHGRFGRLRPVRTVQRALERWEPHGGQRRDLRSEQQRPATRRLDQRRRRGVAHPARTRPLRRGPGRLHRARDPGDVRLHQSELPVARPSPGRGAGPAMPADGREVPAEAGLRRVELLEEREGGARRLQALRADRGRQRQRLVLPGHGRRPTGRTA